VQALLAKINKLTWWQVAIALVALGYIVFWTGLASPFLSDDIPQIVENPVVHSIANMFIFFIGGTFYNGHGLAPLSGSYYRPLITTVFSLIYTQFGTNALPFHLIQILFSCTAAFLLYIFFKYSFGKTLSLYLAAVFLIHPLNSQTVFAIASMQESLFFIFGILSLLILIRYKSNKALLLAALFLFVSLLFKESGALFVVIAGAYLFLFERKRFLPLVGVMVLPMLLYLVMRFLAVGLIVHQNIAPIDRLDLIGRMFTMPSILLFYLVKFVFPWQLATGYYWTYPTFSFQNVLLPLIVDLAIIILFVYLGFRIQKRATQAMFYAYLFFSLWTTIGLLLYMQITPLDFTASEPWFYFPMAGLLGMLGVISVTFPIRIERKWLIIAASIILCVLGVSTALRGTVWSDSAALASEDKSVSKNDYIVDESYAKYMIRHGRFSEAKTYAQQSVNTFPSFTGYDYLGQALAGLKDYAGAEKAYDAGIKFGNNFSYIYQDKAMLMLVYGDPTSDKMFLLAAVDRFPEDSELWTSLAVFEDMNIDNADAKVAITTASKLGQVPADLSGWILNNQPFSLHMANLSTDIAVQ
jgi:protein O-mannosyl-transferase